MLLQQTSIRHSEVTPKRFSHAGDFLDLYENESVQKYVKQLMEEYTDISQKLQHAHLSESDRKAFIKKHAELVPLANVFKRTEQAKKDLEEVLSVLHSK